MTLHIVSTTSRQLQRVLPLQLTTFQQLQLSSMHLIGSTVVLDVGELTAFDVGTGLERWRTAGSLNLNLPSGRSDIELTQTGAGTGSPVSVTALDPHTGKPRWVGDLGPSIYGAAATRSSVVVFERDGDRAVDPKTGKRNWQLHLRMGVTGVAG